MKVFLTFKRSNGNLLSATSMNDESLERLWEELAGDTAYDDSASIEERLIAIDSSQSETYGACSEEERRACFPHIAPDAYGRYNYNIGDEPEKPGEEN